MDIPCSVASNNSEHERHVKYMAIAVDKSKEGAEQGKGEPFGCVIVQDNNTLIAAEHNRIYELFDPTAHGEMVAIRTACKSLKTTVLKNCVLYTSAEPCQMCSTAIQMSGIDKIYYCVTGSEVHEAFKRVEDFEKLGLHEKQDLHREVPRQQLLLEEGLKTIHKYLKVNEKKAQQ